MNWETGGDGWYPTLQRGGDSVWVAYGNVGARLTSLVNGATAQVSTTGRNTCWLSDHELTWTDTVAGTLRRVVDDYATGHARITDDNPALLIANDFDARDGHWASWMASGGRVAYDNRELVRGVGGKVSVSGDRLVHYSAGYDGIWVWEGGQCTRILDARVIPNRHQLTLRGDYILFGGLGPVWAMRLDGQAQNVTCTPWRYEWGARVVFVRGEPWVASASFHPHGGGLVLLRPLGDRAAIVVGVEASTFDVLVDDEDFVIAAASDRGHLVVTSTSVDAPRVELSAAIERFDRPLHAGYFFQYSSQYGDNPHAPGNVTIVADPGAALRAPGRIIPVNDLGTLDAARSRWADVVAVYVAAEVVGSQAALEAACAAVRLWMSANHLPRRPIISYAGGEIWNVQNADWIGVQLYVDPAEDPGTWEGVQQLFTARRFPQLLDRIPANRTIALICQAYGRNYLPGTATPAWRTPETLEALQVAFVEVARHDPRVQIIAWFSDGRPTGTRDNEYLRPWHQALVDALPGAPDILTLGTPSQPAPPQPPRPPAPPPPIVRPPDVPPVDSLDEDDHMPQLKLPCPTFDQWVMQDAPKVYAAFEKKNKRKPTLQDASFQTMRYFHYWIGITEDGRWRPGEYWPVERMVAHELGEDDSPERFPQP